MSAPASALAERKAQTTKCHRLDGDPIPPFTNVGSLKRKSFHVGRLILLLFALPRKSGPERQRDSDFPSFLTSPRRFATITR
jgi:hypothetical protein